MQTLPGGAALVVLALDLAINPVVAVRAAAIDLPGFGHDESRVMHRQQFAAFVINHRLPFVLHLAHLLLRRWRIETYLEPSSSNREKRQRR
jgi:hypothetical protein